MTAEQLKKLISVSDENSQIYERRLARTANTLIMEATKGKLDQDFQYSDYVEIKLNEADKIAETSEERLSQDDVFRREECGKEVSRSVFTKENRYEAINI